MTTPLLRLYAQADRHPAGGGGGGGMDGLGDIGGPSGDLFNTSSSCCKRHVKLRSAATLENDRLCNHTQMCLVEVIEEDRVKIDLQWCAIVEHLENSKVNKSTLTPAEMSVLQRALTDNDCFTRRTVAIAKSLLHESKWCTLPFLNSTIVDLHCGFWSCDRYFSGYREVSVHDSASIADIAQLVDNNHDDRPVVYQFHQYAPAVIPQLLVGAERFLAVSPLQGDEVTTTGAKGLTPPPPPPRQVPQVAMASVALSEQDAVKMGVVPSLDSFKSNSEFFRQVNKRGNLKALHIGDFTHWNCGYDLSHFYFSVPGHENVENVAFRYDFTQRVGGDAADCFKELFDGIVCLRIEPQSHDTCFLVCREGTWMEMYQGFCDAGALLRALAANISSPACTLRRIDFGCRDFPGLVLRTDSRHHCLHDIEKMFMDILDAMRTNTSVRTLNGMILSTDTTYAMLARLLRENTTLDSMWMTSFLIRSHSQVEPIVAALQESNTSLLSLSAVFHQVPPESAAEEEQRNPTTQKIRTCLRQLNAETLRNRSVDVRARMILKRLVASWSASSATPVLDDIIEDQDLYILAAIPRHRLCKYMRDHRSLLHQLRRKISSDFFRLTGICKSVPETYPAIPLECWCMVTRYLRVTDIL